MGFREIKFSHLRNHLSKFFTFGVISVGFHEIYIFTFGIIFVDFSPSKSFPWDFTRSLLHLWNRIFGIDWGN
jgi:hypothetical protein